MPQQAVVIVGAKRTPIGAFNGALAGLEAHELGAAAISAALAQASIAPARVDELIMGQVLGAGAGMNPARQAAYGAAIPEATTAFGVNQVCGSGLRAVALGLQQIACGDARIVVAGGQESMSLAPHLARLRTGRKLGDLALIDSLQRDGLTDAFHGCAMGVTAENVARECGIDRKRQDAFALRSQQRAAAAQHAGRFKAEIAAVTVHNRRGESVVDQDEYIRHDANARALAALRPAFIEQGSVTAGNASGINDGAAALILMPAELAAEKGLVPLARIVSWASAGVDPQLMGLGPVPASLRALNKAGWGVEEVELWEVNEAFAAQALAVIDQLGIDSERVNVNGGAIALGHPIGASGARVLVTLLYELARRELRRGLATLCIGGGMGIALCVEREQAG